jgi:type IX secretion system PorP/SprF family membrane protein
VLSTKAQDIHFSQFYAAPLYMNPAKTGFYDGNYRMTAIYRNQWRSVTVPYQTISGSIDFSIPGGFDNKDLFGLGLIAYSDRAGDSHFTTNMFEGSVAFNKSLDRWGRNYLGFGLQGGYVNSFLDYTYLSFDENFEGGNTTENFTYNTAGYLDVNAGMEWNFLPNKFSNFNLGFNVSHINRPLQTFQDDVTSALPLKYVASAAATIPLASMAALYPKIAYSTQGPHQELVFGAFGKIAMDKKANQEKSVYMGALNRWKDAVIFVARLDLNEVSFTFSYDFNYSKLARVSHMQGGPEIAVQYIGGIPSMKKHKLNCPHF